MDAKDLNFLTLNDKTEEEALKNLGAKHSGDNRDGLKVGDDETIELDL